MKSFFISLLFLWTLDTNGQCSGNILFNGSFNSVEGEAVIAPDWSGQSSPDINDASGSLNSSTSYNWTGTPLPSSDGGTWQNVFSQSEFIEQTVNVIPGKSYTVNFEYAAQGIISDLYTFTGPVGINVYINDTLVAVTPNDVTPYTWENYAYSFVPTAEVLTIKFSASGYEYAAIDGVCLSFTSPVVHMPNVFTPNNDGLNDVFRPVEMNMINQASLQILNRWGELMYITNDILTGWDGKINGEICSDGVYFWIINYTTEYEQQLKSQGYFHLIQN